MHQCFKGTFTVKSPFLAASEIFSKNRIGKQDIFYTPPKMSSPIINIGQYFVTLERDFSPSVIILRQ